MGKAARMRTQGKEILSGKRANRVRAIAAAFLASGVGMAIAGAPAASAMKTPHVDGNGDIAVCQFSVHVNLTGHGLTVSEILAGASGNRTVRFTSDRGIVNCTGRVNDHTVAGNGSAEMTGSYQASPLCATGVGTGSITMQVPRFLEFFGQSYETLQGDFGLDLSGTDWRQLGSVVDDAGAESAFSALSHLKADAGSLCTERAGTLTGYLAVGGTSSQRESALQASS
jgi:hypothetical protein